jgi:hypothetical protein
MMHTMACCFEEKAFYHGIEAKSVNIHYNSVSRVFGLTMPGPIHNCPNAWLIFQIGEYGRTTGSPQALDPSEVGCKSLPVRIPPVVKLLKTLGDPSVPVFEQNLPVVCIMLL